ncbi:RecQ family ATP-dependent DNA helicase [Subsaximicrobium wynnwilliamsii]|jgi:ATP-dependent DNA helicase RecQ|uniref:ATP-dependent DNA helicase RecQ n=1 Tax=Subsaximicrobium wynnwilliamsii TaxID=291179 RepID=A0A5C6ZML5_9FLAO|nr:RecQ family ATP-dependent DNA helicase [Subsaximicrobium wynnwilliamsii]TXD84266.1 RecQ family ATP-dependent DNA helicase [Subsaximicrobium wynnwilliamsii]TXD89887.1 RecQ family ATP-dependent DNA helicase [Subsaximicrobium wynnwilliamsii]TXE03978.1 RecQ family ATP-dependent DNA helicase [Subsaximicrobium wynnwilliamsii]
MSHPINILERYWQHTSFRPLQEEIITAVLNNEDTFVLLPTGGGKSVCFQVPALVKDGICIVISPLIALMKDQVNALKLKGIKAMALTSGISYQDLDTLLDNCIYGNYKFLYLSPERLQQDIVQQRIAQMNVNLIAVDEAHCISQWGNDFRPAYLNIALLRELLPSVNVIALTATAKPNVIEETMSALDFIAPKVFRASFERPNIAYKVFYSEDKLYDLEQVLKKYPGASIIYVRSRKASVEIHDQLTKLGFDATFFHGGIPNKEKQERLDHWMNNRKRIMVATTAFGMGIDKPDVKTVVHMNLPESLESYYQEAGRAGRNNEKAHAILLYNASDEILLKNQFIRSLPSIDAIKLVYRKLCNYFQIPFGEGETSMHQFDFNDFCKTYDFNPLQTYAILQLLDRNSIIKLSQQFNYKTRLQFILSNAAVFHYLERHQSFQTIVKSILRTYGGIFEHELAINLHLIATKASTSEKEIIAVLNTLKRDGVAEFMFSNTDSEIVFIQPREDDMTINRIAKTVEQQMALKTMQVNSVLEYIKNDDVCRSVQLLSYFGEETGKPCGICSVCTAKGAKKTALVHSEKQLEQTLVQILSTRACNSRQLTEQCKAPKEQVLKAIKNLLELQKIECTEANTYRLKNL